jgi:aminoglycoside phosphotransferase (APT) family kinase protein
MSASHWLARLPLSLGPNLARPIAQDGPSLRQVAEGLRNYLGQWNTDYLEPPCPLGDGWETYTYSLRIRPDDRLPAALNLPLVLRLYASAQGQTQACHEAAVAAFLRRQGFPVPQPVLCEKNSRFLRGPFVLMERVPGRPLTDWIQANVLRLLDLSREMGRLHARLHQLAPDGCPHPTGPFLDRQLQELRSRIDVYALEGLRPGLDWLTRHRPPPSRSCHILHLDFQPLNILRANDKQLTVIDWGESDVGDYHADVAMTLLLIRYIPFRPARAWERLLLPLGRLLLERGYLSAYRAELPLDAQRLSYFGAWATLRRLVRYGIWLCAGPASTGAKPSSLRRLQPEHLRALEAYFQQLTGERLFLDAEHP